MATWYVASQNPGTSTFLDTDLVAVNFWVRTAVDGANADGIKAAASGLHPEWDRKTVVMLNPAANHLPGFRRSTTCHAVRRWAEAHDYDSAVYLNLFSYIEPNSTFLRRVPARELNGPEADAVLERVGRAIDGAAIAGWGDLPPGLDRRLYDRRVAQVEQLLDRPLLCLGVTRNGSPRHGRGWRPTDEPMPLP